MVAFRGPGFNRRRRFAETDAVAALFKYVQAEAKPAGGFDMLCGFPPRQLAPMASTPLKDADVHGQAVQMKRTPQAPPRSQRAPALKKSKAERTSPGARTLI